MMRVADYFAVPPNTFNRASWMRPATANRAADKAEVLERPYAPCHGPGHDPYLITVERTETDRRTSFRGEVNPT